MYIIIATLKDGYLLFKMFILFKKKSSFYVLSTKLSIKNTLKSIADNRVLFHIAIAKKSDKEKEFYYRKTMRRIKKFATGPSIT